MWDGAVAAHLGGRAWVVEHVGAARRLLAAVFAEAAAAAEEALAADANDLEALAARLALGVRLAVVVRAARQQPWLDAAASVAAVSPKWLVTAASAPAASSLRMMSRCPFSHAFMSAVVPCFVCELTGMPRESACSTSSSWPASAASISPDA